MRLLRFPASALVFTALVVAALVVASAVLTGAVLTGVAGAATPAGVDVGVDVPTDGVALADQTDWLEVGESFDLWVEVGDDVGDDDALVVDLHAPVTSRSQFTATLRGDVLRSRLAEYVVPVSELPTGPDGTRRLRLTPRPTQRPGERALRTLPRPGVYPMVVGLRPADAGVDPPEPFVTYLVHTPGTGTTPLRVAVVQPLASDLALQPDGTLDLGPDDLERLLALSEVLVDTSNVPLTFAPRPETLEALRLLAAAGADPRSDEATAILDALATASARREVVSRPFVDVTVDALVAAGLGDELTRQRQRGDEVARATLGVATDPTTWIDDEGLGARALERLGRLGVEHVVVPDEVLQPVQLRLSLTRPFRLAADGDTTLAAASPDPALAAHYATDDPVLGAQHLLADLAVLQGDAPGPLSPRGVVVAPPPRMGTDPVLLAQLLDGLAGSPILEPVTLGEYFDDVEPQEGPTGPLVRAMDPAGGRLGLSSDDLAAVRGQIEALSTVVVDDTDAERALGDHVLVAEADGLSPGQRRRHLAVVPEELRRRLGSVSVVDGDTFRLPDSEGTIPLTLVRSGSEALSVRVVLESDKLSFQDSADEASGRVTYDVDLTSENTPLVVPVRVRSPGTFPLRVTITSPDGRIELVRAQVTIRSTAFSGVGVALSAGAGSFLLLWWARHWRTVRRAKRLVPVG